MRHNTNNYNIMTAIYSKNEETQIKSGERKRMKLRTRNGHVCKQTIDGFR